MGLLSSHVSHTRSAWNVPAPIFKGTNIRNQPKKPRAPEARTCSWPRGPPRVALCAGVTTWHAALVSPALLLVLQHLASHFFTISAISFHGQNPALTITSHCTPRSPTSQVPQLATPLHTPTPAAPSPTETTSHCPSSSACPSHLFRGIYPVVITRQPRVPSLPLCRIPLWT